MDKPEYIAPQEENLEDYKSTETDIEAPSRSTSEVISIEELAENPKLISKRVWQLAWPAMVELLLSTLFSMVDMIMVGRISYQALTAVGLTNHPTMLALAVFQALNVGSTALVARFIGSGDIKNAKATVRQSLVLVTILGVVVSIGGYLLSPAIVTFMRAEPDVYPMSVSYLQIVSLGWLFTTISLNIGAILRGSGDTMTPMRYNLFSNLLNVFGNYVLIFGKFGFPAMGVAGAALSTTLCRGVAAFLALRAIFNKNKIIGVSLKDDYRIDKNLLERLISIGLPSAMEQFPLRLGQVFFSRAVAGLGTAVYAAHQTAVNISSLTFTPGQAFGMAATTMVGQSLGANHHDVAEKAGLAARRMGLIIALAIAIVLFFFGYDVALLYTDEPEVARAAANALKILAIMQPMQSTQFILAGALRGAGDTRWPLYSTAIGIWGIRVVLVHVFIAMGMGLMGAWVAQLCDQAFRAVFIYSRYKSGAWKHTRV
ncbi:MATE family efflux transporter [Acetomicrobium flavidum]|uniref:MATE family efflux transporter n=1 Tax=Acetomicrobium flavidum TaxID=49896 RepID=UPI002989FA79